jgi:hypothetical protein
MAKRAEAERQKLAKMGGKMAASCETEPLSAHFSVTTESLASLSPHRLHESNWFKNLLCSFGWHRWYHVQWDGSAPAKTLLFCRWCPKVELPGRPSGD